MRNEKKIIITLAIFFGIAILVVFCLFQYLNKNQLLENTTYTPQDRVNHNFDLNLDSNIPTTVIFDTTNNFRTDGELYFIVDYSTYSDDKIEQELALTTFSKKIDSSIENQINELISLHDISNDKLPPFEKDYIWKEIQDKDQMNTLYYIFFPDQKELYVYADIV